MKVRILILLSMILAGFSASSTADMFEPIPFCYKPTKPLWLSTAYYARRYQRDVGDYQHCMKDFIRSQELAAKVHSQAAKKALQSWQAFSKKK
ncbi:hypothetical protein [sulfur-oxidizing endosymbiont of Gigantopelta aegis]|uniref:hypothetical protein n=1 Tax=sulfur-oxidizing endosymbiont of Gigantopelta aegis TaxID=2794934 RepID=UPI0018DCD444|nr:hypothetical protein [sulfur-oxidizing endosymbiont of Gigantopelta aegis]